MLPFPRSTAHAPTPATTPRRRRASALAVATALAASAAACSSGGTSTGASASGSVDPYDVAASVQASESATAPVSLSPEDAALREAALAMEAPEKPARMSENSPEGAVAAAEYFISLYPYVYATGDLTEWDAICDQHAELCTSVRGMAADLHAQGGWADPWDQTVIDRQYNETASSENSIAVRLTVDSAAIVRHSGNGDITADPADPDALFEGQMTWAGDSWHVTGGGFQ